tara:strand:- start:162226 stop:162690 length:465 start_codon:yes stop_codon:yes gene_type:complete
VSSSLQVSKVEDDKQVEFKLSGQIDEDADLSLLATDKEKVIFDLENISLINSCGIRDWVQYQGSLPVASTIIYRKCPQVIVEQLNIIKGFIKPGGIVESFFAPYYNDAKDEEVKLLITPDEVVDNKAPVKKDSDGNELEFDEIELQYFNFLKSK